jgi:hypothetical protein
MKPEPDTQHASESASRDLLGKAFAAGLAVAYATGFLVVSTFLHRFGVSEPGTDLLKLKYLQVGILHALFPTIILGSVFAFFYIREHPDTAEESRMPRIALVNIGNLLLLCYWLATFANPGYFHEKGAYIAALFAWTIFWIAFGRTVAGKGPSHFKWFNDLTAWCEAKLQKLLARVQRYRSDAVRVTIMTGLVTADFLIKPVIGTIAIFVTADILFFLLAWRAISGKHFPDMHSPLIENIAAKALAHPGKRAAMIAAPVILSLVVIVIAQAWYLLASPAATHAFFYYFFCILGAAVLWSDRKRIPERYALGGARAMAWFFTLCIVSGLYYMTILGFAYGVFPHIPASKGGGDFAASPNVELFIKADALPAIPTNIVPVQCRDQPTKQANTQQPPATNPAPTKSVPLIIIHETETQLFVADPQDRVDLGNNLTGPQNWSLWRTPTVTALRKDIIVSIVHLPAQRAAPMAPEPGQATQPPRLHQGPPDAHSTTQPQAPAAAAQYRQPSPATTNKTAVPTLTLRPGTNP